MEEAEKKGKILVIMFLDLNGFKQVNDIYGHAAGDKVLKVVAKRLELAIRSGDHISRLGGDEYLIGLLMDKDHIAIIAQPMNIEGIRVRVGSSIGLSAYPIHGNKISVLLDIADKRMYDAKKGRDTASIKSSFDEQDNKLELSFAIKVQVMSDVLHRFQLENLHVRGEWVSLDSSWREILGTAEYPEPVKKVLGEALVSISLLAESLKFDGSLVLQIRGANPVSMLVVQATSDGAIRGMANWQGEISNNTKFQDLFITEGQNVATMVISVEPNSSQGERYQSLVALEGESLADSFTQYFAQSEQLKTRLWLAVDDTRAVGMMLQCLPSESSEIQNEGWDHATILADTVTEEDCSNEKIENTVRSIGEKEANSIIEEQGQITIDCDFCNTQYKLDSIDVKRLFVDSDVTDISGTGSVH
ncbi:chaperonin [Nymphon striatum]|nr:chaperonin [Nymphon striatum]